MKKIALVNHDPEYLSLLQSRLKVFGYDPVVFTEPTTILDAINSAQPDLVILDIETPGINPFDILLHLENNYDALPVVASSSENDADTIERAMASGASDFIVKPFEFSILIEKIVALLAES